MGRSGRAGAARHRDDVPRVEDLLERPFSRIPQRRVADEHGGFVLGLALGAVYVPCAGPVLAAITVAGATGRIGVGTVALTVAFAVGTAIPLLVFALAGRRVAERVRAFRSRQRGVRIAAGVVVIALAVALTFNVTDALQRAVPDYTSNLNAALDKSGACPRSWRPAGPARRSPSARESAEEHAAATAARRRRSPVSSSGSTPPGSAALTPAVVAGQGRPGRLLGVLLHQLPARHHARAGLVQRLRRRRPGGDRRADARVRLRGTTPATSRRARSAWASPTRSPSTTSTRPGTTSATNPGPPTTSSTPPARSASPRSARATTPTPSR